MKNPTAMAKARVVFDVAITDNYVLGWEMTDELSFQQLSHRLAYLLNRFGKRRFSCLSRVSVNGSVLLPNMLKLAIVGPKEKQTEVVVVYLEWSQEDNMDVGLQ